MYIDDKIVTWSAKYRLEELKLVGYQGGFPIIQFKKNEYAPVTHKDKETIDKAIRKAETYGGIELGVGYNFRKTAFLNTNDDNIVICGHEYVIDRIFEYLF